MSEIATGFKLYLGVILGEMAIAGIVFLGCIVLAAISVYIKEKEQ